MWIDPAHFLRLWRRPGAWRGHLVLVSLPEAGGGCKDELISQSMLAGSPRGRPVKSPFTLLTQGGRQKKGENEATSNENKRPGQRIALAVRISKSIRHFLSPWLFFFVIRRSEAEGVGSKETRWRPALPLSVPPLQPSVSNFLFPNPLSLYPI